MPALGLSFRTKLLATYVVLVAAVGGGIVYAVDRRLGDDLVAALDERLEDQARAVSSWLARSGHPPRLARRLSTVVDARVTVIDAHGIVEGDSEIEEDRLGVDPEGASAAVEEARAGRVGREIRHSTLAGEEMYYLAVPAGAGRVVRLAVPTGDIEATRRGLRQQLLWFSLIAFAGALVLGLLATRAIARPLQRMTEQARRLADGGGEIAPPLASRDELGVLSRTLASLAGQVRERIADLERERDLLSTVIGSLVEGVVVVDAAGHVLLDNPPARSLLDTERGAPLADPELRELVARAGEQAGPAEAEMTLRGRSLLVGARPLRHGDAAAVVVLYDVTRMRRLESVRRDFVANLTHELRTPVTSIRGYAETLVSSRVDEATRAEFLQTIQRNAVRIGRLVDDLLVLQELDARPRARVAAGEVALGALVDQVLRTAQPNAERAGVTLSAAVEPELRAIGDADGLEQVLLNLVDNAVKYGAAGGAVRVKAARRGGRVELAVEDDGPGIAPEHLERVFERFYRVDAGRSREQGGTGLGLAIVKNMTESMGGTVTVESEPDKGCRFLLSLPAEAAP